jgi:UDP-N-acetylglucosamine 2-epimerase
MKVLTAIGARPQFIKAAPVSRAFERAGIHEVVVHSGQHYDHDMSGVFFEELGLREPDVNLGAGSGSHAEQTARMLIGFEQAIGDMEPDWVIVHGDTNSTLAAALAAVKLGVRVGHNEAGLRSFNRVMPEEHNRVLTDHCADLLFCPTSRAAEQLSREGIRDGVHVVGDVMYDTCLLFGGLASDRSRVLERLGVVAGGYLLATLHRPYNVDSRDRMTRLLGAFARTGEPVVLPQHPRLARRLAEFALPVPKNVLLTEPVGYLDMTQLERRARLILTDSGGVQKEAYFHGVPCVTLRTETEWMETVEVGWNRVVDADEDAILECVRQRFWPDARPEVFGDGRAAERLVALLAQRDSPTRSPQSLSP